MVAFWENPSVNICAGVKQACVFTDVLATRCISRKQHSQGNPPPPPPKKKLALATFLLESVGSKIKQQS